MVVADGDYLIAPVSAGAEELLPEAENKLFFKEVDVQWTFVKDKQGRVTHLIIHQLSDKPEVKKNKW